MASEPKEKDMEMCHRTAVKDAKCYSYEEALDLTGSLSYPLFKRYLRGNV